MNSIIKHLVEELPSDEASTEEDIPIEFYEMEELALERVMIRSAFRIHLVIYVIFNIGFFCINLSQFNWYVKSIYDLWTLWILSSWGMAVWTHGWVVKTKKIPKYQHRMFVIITNMLIYLLSYLIFINYFGTFYGMGITIIWWPYTIPFIVGFIIVRAYFAFYQDNEQKIKAQVIIEIEKMKEEYELEIEKMTKFVEQMKIQNVLAKQRRITAKKRDAQKKKMKKASKKSADFTSSNKATPSIKSNKPENNSTIENKEKREDSKNKLQKSMIKPNKSAK